MGREKGKNQRKIPRSSANQRSYASHKGMWEGGLTRGLFEEETLPLGGAEMRRKECNLTEKEKNEDRSTKGSRENSENSWGWEGIEG